MYCTTKPVAKKRARRTLNRSTHSDGAGHLRSFEAPTSSADRPNTDHDQNASSVQEPMPAHVRMPASFGGLG